MNSTPMDLVTLRPLASLRWLLRRGIGFAQEQELTELWLAAIERGARAHWALGHEIALCGRLLKGYGSTNECGKQKLLHVIDHLAQSQTLAADTHRTEAISAARTGALAEEGGAALDLTLKQNGAPARPVKAVPIRFMRRPNAVAPSAQPARQ